jgi:hypothetical protein
MMRAINTSGALDHCGIPTTISQFFTVAKQPQQARKRPAASAHVFAEVAHDKAFIAMLADAIPVADPLLRSEKLSRLTLLPPERS